MAMFNSFLYVYQRVNPPLAAQPFPPLSLNERWLRRRKADPAVWSPALNHLTQHSSWAKFVPCHGRWTIIKMTYTVMLTINIWEYKWQMMFDGWWLMRWWSMDWFKGKDHGVFTPKYSHFWGGVLVDFPLNHSIIPIPKALSFKIWWVESPFSLVKSPFWWVKSPVREVPWIPLRAGMEKAFLGGSA